MKARTKRRITETIIGLFSVAALVLTFKIFVLPASRGEKVRFRFTLIDPDTMNEETGTGDGDPETTRSPDRGLGRSGIPAALAGLRLPTNPDEVPDVLVSRNISIFRVLQRACPADHEWVDRALSALEDRAESDTLVRNELRSAYGPRVLSGEICASDLGRLEAWLRQQLRKGWENGLLDDSVAPGHYRLLTYLSLSDDTATRGVFREIAGDGAVAHYWRDLAARFMVDQHYGSIPDDTDPRYVDVVQSVLLDLAASAPPLPGFERYHLEWLDLVLDPGDPFFAGYADAFRRAGRELPDWWSRRGGGAIARGPESGRPGAAREGGCVSAPARQLSDSGFVSNMMARYRPDGTKRSGVGGTAVLHLKVDTAGRVTEAEIAESSGNRGLDTASVWTARWIRFEPAVSCGAPVDAEVTYTLQWAEWKEGGSS